MDDDREPVSQIVGGPADVGIVDAVLLELRQDAATTHLDLRVSSSEGVVRLRGIVEDIEDAENAEAVAARVPGVVEVIDETEVRRM
jgi:osmotically-inducible protein OsmY